MKMKMKNFNSKKKSKNIKNTKNNKKSKNIKKTKKKMHGGVNPKFRIGVEGNTEVSSPFLYFPVTKKGTPFGENSKGKAPLLPPYIKIGDLHKFISSFSNFRKHYNKAFKNVEPILNYEKIKAEINMKLSGIQPSSKTNTNSNAYSNLDSVSTTSTTSTTSNIPSNDQLALRLEAFIKDMDDENVKQLLKEYESLNPITRIDPNTGNVNTFFNAPMEPLVESNNEKRKNDELKKKLRDHLYQYHKTRLHIKHAYESIEKQAKIIKSITSHVKDLIRRGVYEATDINELLQSKHKNQQNQNKYVKEQKEGMLKLIPQWVDELRQEGMDEQSIKGLINYNLKELEHSHSLSENNNNERIDKIMETMDILFDKVKSIKAEDKPHTYSEAMVFLFQDPDRFFEEHPNFFDKSQGTILSFALKKYLPWLINIGIANNFFMSTGIGYELQNNNNNNNTHQNPVLKSYKTTGKLSENDLKYLIEKFDPNVLLSKMKGSPKTVTGQKSTRSFSDMLDYQFEREAKREKSEPTPRTVVQFVNEAGKGPLTKVFEGNKVKSSSSKLSGQLLNRSNNSNRSGMVFSTIGHIQEHQNARLLKILLRLGPLISDKPEDLIKTLLPNTEPGIMPSSQALEHVRKLFPDDQDYQNFLKNGHDQMDSLLIDLLILQDLIPEGHEFKKEPSRLQKFISNIKEKILPKKSISRTPRTHKIRRSSTIILNNTELETDLEILDEQLEEWELEGRSSPVPSSSSSLSSLSLLNENNNEGNNENSNNRNSNNAQRNNANNNPPDIFYDASNNPQDDEFKDVLKELTPYLKKIREVWV